MVAAVAEWSRYLIVDRGWTCHEFETSTTEDPPKTLRITGMSRKCVSRVRKDSERDERGFKVPKRGCTLKEHYGQELVEGVSRVRVLVPLKVHRVDGTRARKICQAQSPPLAWCGTLGEGVPAQVPSSFVTWPRFRITTPKRKPHYTPPRVAS
ncbi:hypothetical protein TNCV_4414691 [Trichonephila clavipes]|uniref:Uncharacterized protein n=1 Tax=Trichonephila clavipes TaxID=2585209 RepID=A0A8X6S254_TRICX|nr:hypothetical protein TNCV_4414691 [Trichonephila clavipes]